MIAIFSLYLFQRFDFNFLHMVVMFLVVMVLDMVVYMEVDNVAIIVVDMELGKVADDTPA